MVNNEKKKISRADKIEWMLGLCVLIITTLTIMQIEDDYERVMGKNEKGYTIVVDAGHGGKDPGKIGITGQLEKDINLMISQKVKEQLEKEGMHVIMTRTEDVTATGSKDSSKGEDMNARIDIINQEMVDLCVSIHQNSYTSEEVSGAQVFYYTNSKEGKTLAQKIQGRLIEFVNPQNHRQEKADNSYYILLHSSCPTVIVECGFLSNSKEALSLEKPDYQDKIAQAICLGIQDYLSR